MQTYLDATFAAFCQSLPADLLAEFHAGDILLELMGGVRAALDHNMVRHDRPAFEFLCNLHLLMCPELADGSVSAFSVAAESVGFYRKSKPSGAVRAASLAEIGSQAVTFVNVPHHSFPIGGNLQIRGVLATLDAGRILLTAAVAPRGSNKVRHMRWRLGETSPEDVTDIWLRSYCQNGYKAEWNTQAHEQGIEDHLGMKGRALAALLREIENVLLLTVAQYRSIVDAGEADVEEVPHLPIDDHRRRTGNRKAAARNFSLFRIRRLSHLDGITIMYERASNPSRSSPFFPHDGPIRLCDVRGHFRMQPYGTKSALRKLIWVSPHERWIACDGRTVMHALPVTTDEH